MLALPIDLVYLLVVVGAMVAPVLLGCYIATSRWVAPGIDHWYKHELSEEALRRYEAELEKPLEFSDEEIVHDGEVIDTTPRAQWLRGGDTAKYDNGRWH